MERPRLRELEPLRVEHEGQPLVALRDPANLTDQVLVLSRGALAAASLMDGTRTLEEIRREMETRMGASPPLEHLEELVRRLDAALMLDSDAFRSFRADLEQDFRDLHARPAFLAGRSYPAEAGALARHLEGLLGGPAREGAGGRPLVGLFAPHIDLERGGEVYGRTYRELRGAEPADLYVVLGTSHAPTRRPFALTRKDYETPMGPVSTARDLVDRLASRVGPEFFEDEFNHRAEHSIEFQALFLRHVLAEAPPFQVLPILCGLSLEAMRTGREPGRIDEVRRFLEGLREVLAGSGRRVRYLGGVDLAHVGEQFGDRGRLTPEFLDQVEKEDRGTLERAVAQDPDGFWHSVVDDGDRRRVCGLAPIYAMLSIMPRAEGRLLDYRQCVDAQGTCCVTIAGVGYYA